MGIPQFYPKNNLELKYLYLIYIKKYNIYKIGITKDIEFRLSFSKGIGFNCFDSNQQYEWERKDIEILHCKIYENSKDIEKEIKQIIKGKTVTLIDASNSKRTYHEHFYEQSLQDVLLIIKKYE